MIRNGEISCVELLAHYLHRVDSYNETLNAVVVDMRDDAMRAARVADEALAADQPCGPLHGVPMTVKESYNLTGVPTTWGNPAWCDNVPTEDSVPVQRLKAAGAIIFGKTNVPLQLADFQTYNEIYGTTNNPYDTERSPGGSSGGAAAALAAGLTGLEAGSDIGGSIRNPAHYCGVFGHKPTWNLLWMRGHAPPGNTRSVPDISVIGPLARGVTDLETVVRQLAGPDDIAARGYRLDLPVPGTTGMKGKKVAVWADDHTCPVSSETRARIAAVAQACRDAGARVDEDARPDFSPAACYETFQFLLQAQMAARMPADEYAGLVDYVNTLDPDDDSRTAGVLRARTSSLKQWQQHNEMRQQMRWKWHAFFHDYHVLLMPVMPTAAFPHDHGKFAERTILVDGDEFPYLDQSFWAGLSGVSYLPSTVIPTGLNEQGLPIGVQIVGPEYGDLLTLGVARQLEAAGFRFVPPPHYS